MCCSSLNNPSTLPLFLKRTNVTGDVFTSPAYFYSVQHKSLSFNSS